MKKRTSRILLCTVCCLLLMPLQVSAADSQNRDGTLQWKIDRIIQNDAGDGKVNTETELEKVYPELFKPETKAAIQMVKQNADTTVKAFEHGLFRMNTEQDTTIKNMKQTLFTEDYEAPKTTASKAAEEKNTSFTNILFAGLACLLLAICGGLYMLMKKFID